MNIQEPEGLREPIEVECDPFGRVTCWLLLVLYTMLLVVWIGRSVGWWDLP